VEQKKDNSKSGSQLLSDFVPHTREQWRREVDNLLKSRSYEKIMQTDTYEGIKLKPIYDRFDTESLTFPKNLPGFFPFLRGTTAEGYIEKSWLIDQNTFSADPAEFNNLLLDALDNGQNSIFIKVDSLTENGIDPIDEYKLEIGKAGISVFRLEDLKIALSKIILNEIPINIVAGNAAPQMFAMLIALVKDAKMDLTHIQGSVGYDPIGILVRSGFLKQGLDAAFNEMKAICTWALNYVPGIRTIGIDGFSYYNAGANAVQELACVLSTGIEYIRKMQEKGLEINKIISQIKFGLGLGSNLFMEIAKIRAARILWAKITSEFGIEKGSGKMFIQAQSGMFNKTRYDAYVNILRSSTEVLSGILGGCDSIQAGAFDKILNHPGKLSQRIARNQQLILREECHLDKIIDPVGGSWYIETLTSEIAEKVWKLIQKIEKQGGIIAALKQEFIQKMIKKTSYDRINDFECRKTIVVGVNKYVNLDEKTLPEPEFYFTEFSKKRIHQACLSKSIKTRVDPTDPVNSMIIAFSEGASLGMVTKKFRKRIKNIVKIEPLILTRLTERIEKMRQSVEKYAHRTGKKPQVYHLDFGSLSDYKQRSELCRDFFGIAGLRVAFTKNTRSAEKVAESIEKAVSGLDVICISVDNYHKSISQIIGKIKEIKPDIPIVLAGSCRIKRESLRKIGVDEVIHSDSNCFFVLKRILKKNGII